MKKIKDRGDEKGIGALNLSWNEIRGGRTTLMNCIDQKPKIYLRLKKRSDFHQDLKRLDICLP